MINLCIVILHYQNTTDTINFINSLKKINPQKNVKINIVIVDNKSPNNTGLKLYNKYNNNDDIDVILLDKNYGFSKANNIGYQYAKKYNPDIIIMSNNDVLIKDKFFIEKLIDIYNTNQDVDIACPDIINKDGFHQNPMRINFLKLSSIYKTCFLNYITLVLLSIPIINGIIYNYRSKRSEKITKKYYSSQPKEVLNEFVPFGAFVIFFKKWIEREKIAFPSDTFMYAEEDFLALYCKKNKYKIKYFPKLIINHLEGQSVKKSNKNSIGVMKFKLKHQTKALKKYVEFYKKLRDGD